MRKLFTSQGVYKYNPVDLYYGRKIIDRKISKNNLLDFKKILDSKEIYFGIIFGTLLGAIRENNFIIHDEDVDVFILEEDKHKFMSLLFDLRENGFEVARYQKKVISIIRKDNYIDIYFFKKKFFGKRICGGYILDDNTLSNPSQIIFFDKIFNTPKDPILFLEKFYGKSWKTPKKNAHATNFSIKLKKILKFLIPDLIIKYLKNNF